MKKGTVTRVPAATLADQSSSARKRATSPLLAALATKKATVLARAIADASKKLVTMRVAATKPTMVSANAARLVDATLMSVPTSAAIVRAATKKLAMAATARTQATLTKVTATKSVASKPASRLAPSTSKSRTPTRDVAAPPDVAADELPQDSVPDVAEA